MSEPFRAGLDFLAGVDAPRSIAAEDSLRTGVEVFRTGVLTFSPADGRTAVKTVAATAAAVSMGSSTVGISLTSTASAGSVGVWRAGKFGFWINSSQSGKYFDLMSLVCCNNVKLRCQL